MNYEIVEIEEFTGRGATVYSLQFEDDIKTVFEHFLEENEKEYRDEILSIINRLKVIGKDTGARESFFKIDEGLPGDGVCALYDNPENKLRLYCIRYGKDVIVLGGGGHKPLSIRAWQEDEKLSKEANLMIKVSRDISKKIIDGEIKWSIDGLKFLGNLTFNNDEDE